MAKYNSEFDIDPGTMSRPRRGKRPMPPGQTRHVYADAAERKEDTTGWDEELENEEPETTRVSPKRRPRNTPRETVHAERAPWLVRFFYDRRLAVFAGLSCIIIGAAILIVLLSHIKSGALNQVIIENMSPEQIAQAGIEVKGGVGPVGAWLGNVLFARGFGLGSLVIAAYFIVMGWYLTVGSRFSFWSLTFKSALLAVTVSITVGLLTYAMATPVFWGGVHGLYVNKWLFDMTGAPGAVMVTCLLLAALAAVFLTDLIRYWRKIAAVIDARKAERLRRVEIQRNKLSEERDIKEMAATQASHDEEKSDDDISDELDRHLEQTGTDSARGLGAALVAGMNAAANDTDAGFSIDDPVADTTDKADKHEAATVTETDEPGFEIDVPVAETGKTTGTVAEQLLAQQGEYDPRAELSGFRFPTLDLLEDRPMRNTIDTDEQQANKDRIIKTLGDYKITVSSIKATVGPTVTLYEIVPTEGIRIAQIKRLEDDIAMSLAAKGIRIIAPMPGKGTVGIEVPNRDPQVVSMRTILASRKFRESKAALPVALGATISNEIFVTDLAAMPHALVAGATGQGKSVGLNVLITSLLYRKHPSELKFVLIDPKMVEFSVYERLRGHYLASLPDEEDAIVTDPSKVLNVLNSLCTEMDNRYAMLRKAAVNKIEDYNRKFRQRRLSPDKGHRYLPYIVVVIDEFADLIMTGGKEIEMPVMRITQKARAVGIHMIIATQRPSTNVLTGLIKANCPTRIAFRVLQNVDSRTILDRPNAERLIGRGDMLYSQGGDMERMQCAFISSDEVEAICDSIDNQAGFEQPYPLPEPAQDSTAMAGTGLPGGGMDRDPLFDEAARFVVQSSTASTSSLQRRFEIGYNRAGKIMDQMEAAGIAGPASGSKPRAVLVDPVQLERILANR